jgi:hypothetical protein
MEGNIEINEDKTKGKEDGPITKTRKAIRAYAENIAKKEQLVEPNESHFKIALGMLRWAKNKNPELFESMVAYGAKYKDLEAESEPGSGDLLATVLFEIFESHRSKIMAEILLKGKNVYGDVIKQLCLELSADDRITIAFEGKEGLLQKWVDLFKAYFPILLEDLVLVASS